MKSRFRCWLSLFAVMFTAATLFADASGTLLDAAIDEVIRQDRLADAAWTRLTSEAEVVARRDQMRELMLAAIGPFPERCDLDVRVTGGAEFSDYRVEKLVFASRPNHHVTAHLFLPKKGKAPYPAILMPCGHDRTGKLSRNHQRAGVVAAREGFAALICDPIDQGERLQHPCQPEGCVHGHVNAGLRAHLLGWGLAQFRIWDGMRAIDVLEARPDIDSSRIGVAGMSGGGTLSAYLFLLDGRLKAACPMGFLTDLTSLVKGRGPQDSEQIVFGQLAFGLNHLSFMLGGYPRPICPGFTYDDFFPFVGSQKTFADAAAVYGRFGRADRIDHLECSGRHGWYESEKLGQVLWMRRWLNDDKTSLPFDPAALNALNAKQGAGDLDYALAGSPQGTNLVAGVMSLPAERSVYDLMADEADRLSRSRAPVTREVVRQILGEPLAVPAGLKRDAERRQGYWFKRGGEDEQAAAVLAWLGHNFIANRVSEMVAEAKAYAATHDGQRMVLKASGADAVAAAHAFFLEPALFASLEITDPPPSWREALKDPSARLDLRTIVFGALKAYDWTDLLPCSTASSNPLLKDWSATGGVPPFGEIRMEHVLPAYAQAMADERAEIAAICAQSAAPDYENTVRRLTLAGAQVDRIRLLMVNYSASCLTPEVEKVAAAQAPILAARYSEIYSNAELFKRVEAVYAQRERLSTERRRVTEAIRRRFLQAGVRLGEPERNRLKEIQSRLDVLSLQFIANINAEDAAFKRDFGFALIKLTDQLAATDDRAERERIFRAAKACCRRDNGHDNRPVALEMLKLRHERAKLLGYRNAAEMLTEHTMAKTPERALGMMMTIERKAKDKVLENRDALRVLMDRDIAEGRLPVGSRLEPWDWDYYQHRLRASKITFSNDELKPYLPRARVFAACFAAAREMYGITVEEAKDAPSFAPGETETYRLRDADGSLLGTLVFDYRPRPSKHAGAWIEPFVYQFRDRNGGEVRPVASQAGSLEDHFTLNNVCTVFHEFGHALHALCSRCEDSTLSGLNGTHEYNEIFSQFNQEIGLDRAYLLSYARNDAGEPVPPELLDRALADRTFGLAAKNIRRIGTSILDLRLHQLDDFDSLDLEACQQRILKEIDWPAEVTIAYEIPMMRHVFVHGYEAGFFAYAWSRVMSEDLLDVFRRHGGLRDPHEAARFRKVFLERGYSHDPTENFREFMGRDPELGPYLKTVFPDEDWSSKQTADCDSLKSRKDEE